MNLNSKRFSKVIKSEAGAPKLKGNKRSKEHFDQMLSIEEILILLPNNELKSFAQRYC